VQAEAGRPLPDYVQEEFDAYLKCGRLEEGFLRVRCESCHAEKLVAFSCKKISSTDTRDCQFPRTASRTIRRFCPANPVARCQQLSTVRIRRYSGWSLDLQ
jgi:hypothetical protein